MNSKSALSEPVGSLRGKQGRESEQLSQNTSGFVEIREANENNFLQGTLDETVPLSVK